MTRVLLFCTSDSSRSHMAEGFARARNEPNVEALSAGSDTGRIHPMAVKVMSEIGIDISRQKSHQLSDLDTSDIDLVITMCRESTRDRPILAGNPAKVNWNLEDPASLVSRQGSITEDIDEKDLAVFRRTRDQIAGLVNDLFDRGYAHALAEAKSQADMIVDNISDGIIAHDMERRIFYFNSAAEEITGYSRDEIINKDCHDAFPGNFCGGKCQFCEISESVSEVSGQEMNIVTKTGEKRVVTISVKKMTDSDNVETGILATFQDVTRERRMARRLGNIHSFSGIIGRNDKMLEVFDLIRDLADSNAPVLIQGESGTGKELVAAAIHNEGVRANKLFVPVNCGALPEALLESELFGHVKGAFTGAIRDKKGRFELAGGGTIFLDEVGDISPAMQVRLLRVLQEGTFERVGSETTIKVDVRVISATNKDISKELEAGRFRDDLYYRLSVVPLWLPPLREKRNDIPLLVDHILKRACEDTGREGVTVAPETLDLMLEYEWPGNIRELQNWIQFAMIKCKDDVIRPEHLPPPRRGEMHAEAPIKRRKRKLDVASVRAALNETNGNKVEAAQVLGVSRATLYRFLDDIDLDG